MEVTIASTTRRRKIFISYRREDAADAAGRMRDWLVQTKRIARDDIFMDVETILPGKDFVEVIKEALAQCKAALVIISPSWIAQVNDPTSYVRMETELALSNNVPVIPVLIGGVKMPSADQLPESIRKITSLNAREVRAASFDYDMDWVRKALGFKVSAGVRWTAVAAVVLLVALSLATLTQVPESHANPFWTLTHPATPTALATATEIPTATTIPPTPTATESEVFQRLYSTVTTNQQATVSYSFLSNDGNNTAWEQTPYGGHQCSFNPPPYHIETFQIGYAYFCYGDPNSSFANFIYTVRTNVVHGDGSSVFVRGSKEFQDFFRLDVGIDGNYFYFIGSQRGNGFSPAIHTGRNVDNVIGVIAQGTRIALFVNGELLEVVSDTVRTDGTIGVGAFANTENAYVNFTYAQIWQL